jgi:hypothetical protein
LILAAKLLEQPLEAGHAFVGLFAVFLPHFQECRFGVSEAVAEGGETIEINLIHHAVIHITVAGDLGVLDHLVGEFPRIGPLKVLVQAKLVAGFQDRIKVDDEDIDRPGPNAGLSENGGGQQNQPEAPDTHFGHGGSLAQSSRNFKAGSSATKAPIISQPFENSPMGEAAFRWRAITGHWPTPSRLKIGAPFAEDCAVARHVRFRLDISVKYDNLIL